MKSYGSTTITTTTRASLQQQPHLRAEKLRPTWLHLQDYFPPPPPPVGSGHWPSTSLKKSGPIQHERIPSQWRQQQPELKLQSQAIGGLSRRGSERERESPAGFDGDEETLLRGFLIFYLTLTNVAKNLVSLENSKEEEELKRNQKPCCTFHDRKEMIGLKIKPLPTNIDQSLKFRITFDWISKRINVKV